jgi:hypothetical protein
MTSKLRTALLFTVGLLVAQAASAQSQGTTTLRVKTDTADVEVRLDGESVGHTPLTVRELAAGKHRITLLKDGYEDYLQDVEVSPGKPNSVFVVMKPRNVKLPDLPLTFKVTHWHRIFRWQETGSCRGTLTVSVDALDYKAEDGSDQFHVPVATIKSVARSVGPEVGGTPRLVTRPTDELALRIETSGRSYTFMAFKETRKDAPEILGEKTGELYDLVLRLWSATLNTPQKSKD